MPKKKGGRNKTPPKSKPPRSKTPPKGNKSRKKKTPPKKPVELVWRHQDKLHLMLKSSTVQQFRDLLTKLSVKEELAASTELSIRVLVPKDGSKDVDNNTKAWISNHLTSLNAKPSDFPTGDFPVDAVRDSLIAHGQLVLLTVSGAVLRVPVGLLSAAYDIGKETKVQKTEDPAALHLKQMQQQVDRFEKTVEERQQDFEKQNTIRYEMVQMLTMISEKPIEDCVAAMSHFPPDVHGSEGEDRMQFALAHLWGDAEVENTGPRWKTIVQLNRAKEQLSALEAQRDEARAAADAVAQSKAAPAEAEEDSTPEKGKSKVYKLGAARLAASHKVVKVGQCQSELVAVTEDGQLMRWGWGAKDKLEPHPAMARLGLSSEDPIDKFACCLTGGAVLTKSAQLARWVDSMYAPPFVAGGDCELGAVEQRAFDVAEVVGSDDAVDQLAVSDEMFCVLSTVCNKVHTVGRLPEKMALAKWVASRQLHSVSTPLQASEEEGLVQFRKGSVQQAGSVSCDGMSIESSDDGVQFKCTRYGKRYALATTGWSAGVHRWQVRIDHDASSRDERGCCIGVGSRPVAERWWEGGSSNNGWYVMRGFDGTCYGSGSVYNSSARSREFSRGDVLTITLDSDRGTLSYQLNGKDLGQLFSGLEGRTLYPALFLYNKDCAATLLDASLDDQMQKAVPAAQFSIGSRVTLKGHKLYAKGTIACMPQQQSNQVLWYRLRDDICNLSVNTCVDQIGEDGTTVVAAAVSVTPTQLLFFARQVAPPQAALINLTGDHSTALVQWDNAVPPRKEESAVDGIVDHLNNADEQRVQWSCVLESATIPFHQTVSAKLEAAFASRSDVAYEVNGNSYHVDWQAQSGPVQINSETGAKRSIERKVEIRPEFGSLQEWKVVFSNGVNVRVAPSLSADRVHEELGTAKHGQVVIATGELSEDGQWIKLTEYAGKKGCWMRWSTSPNEPDLVEFQRKVSKPPSSFVVSGAGMEAANGEYRYHDYRDGVASYIKGDILLLRYQLRSCKYWYLANIHDLKSGNMDHYRCKSSADDPPLDGWSCEGCKTTVEPAPKVELLIEVDKTESSEVEGEEIMSLFRTDSEAAETEAAETEAAEAEAAEAEAAGAEAEDHDILFSNVGAAAEGAEPEGAEPEAAEESSILDQLQMRPLAELELVAASEEPVHDSLCVFDGMAQTRGTNNSVVLAGMSVASWQVWLSVVETEATKQRAVEPESGVSRSVLREWQCSLNSLDWHAQERWLLQDDDCPTVAHAASLNGQLLRLDVLSEQGMALWGVPLPPLAACCFGSLAGLPAPKLHLTADSFTESEINFAQQVHELNRMQENCDGFGEVECGMMEELEMNVDERYGQMQAYELSRMEALMGGAVKPPEAPPQQTEKNAQTEAIMRDPLACAVVCISPVAKSKDAEEPKKKSLVRALTGETSPLWCGWNSAHMAIARNDESMLTQVAADYTEESVIQMLTVQDRWGRTPFFLAMECRHLKLALIMLEWIISHSTADSQERLVSLTTTDVSGRTPLGVLLLTSPKKDVDASKIAKEVIDGFVAAVARVPELVCSVGKSRRLLLIDYLLMHQKDDDKDGDQSVASIIALRFVSDRSIVSAVSRAIMQLHGGVEAMEGFMFTLIAGPAANTELSKKLRHSLVSSGSCMWMDAAVRVYTALFSLSCMQATQTTEVRMQDLELKSKFASFFKTYTSDALGSLATAAAAIVRPLFLGFPLPQMSEHGTSACRIASNLFSTHPSSSVVPEHLCEFRSATSGSLSLPARFVSQVVARQSSRTRRPKLSWQREYEERVVSQLWDFGRRGGIPDPEIQKKMDELKMMSEHNQKDESAKLMKEWAQKEKFLQWVASEERKAREEKAAAAEKERQQASQLPAEVPAAAAKEDSSEIPASVLMKQPATALAMSYHLLVELIVELVDDKESCANAIQRVVRELGESEKWVTSVMEELMVRMEQSAGTTTPNCNNTLLSLLRCSPSDALEVALQRFALPDQLEHGYIAIMLDAVVMWKAVIAQRLSIDESPIPIDQLNKYKLVATPSLLRPIADDSTAEYIRQEAIGKVSEQLMRLGSSKNDTGQLTLVQVMNKWRDVVAHFVDKFTSVAKMLGPSSILILLKSFELKEHSVRSAMSQMRMDAVHRGKLKLEVNRKMARRDGVQPVFIQLLDALVAHEAAAAAERDRSTNLTPLAVNDIVVKFSGETGEGTALLLACFSDAAAELRGLTTMFRTDEKKELKVEAEVADIVEQTLAAITSKAAEASEGSAAEGSAAEASAGSAAEGSAAEASAGEPAPTEIELLLQKCPNLAMLGGFIETREDNKAALLLHAIMCSDLAQGILLAKELSAPKIKSVLRAFGKGKLLSVLKQRMADGQVTTVADEELQSMSEEQLIEKHALYTVSPAHTLHFSPVPTEGCKEGLERFRQIGLLLGYGLLCNVPVPIIFYRHVYKFLLQRPVSLADMLYTDKPQANMLSELLQKAERFRTGRPGGEDPESWDTVFESEDGKIMTDEDGEDIIVNMSNLNAFVRWQVAKHLTLPIRQELEAMRQGILQIVPESVLTGLTAEDLQMLLSGRSVAPTVEELQKFITIVDKRLPATHGRILSQADAAGRTADEWITKDDFEVMFWEMAGMMEPSEYTDFVAYVTGSPVLHSQMEIQISDPPENVSAGPFARQCMSSLRVPCCVWGESVPEAAKKALEEAMAAGDPAAIAKAEVAATHRYERLDAPMLLHIFRSAMALATEFDTV